MNTAIAADVDQCQPRKAPAARLRVLILIENMSYTYDTRVRNIAGTLRSTGMQVTVVCPRYAGDPRQRLEGGIDVRYFALPRFPPTLLGQLMEYTYTFIAITAGTLRVLLRGGFDVIHVCNPPDILFPVGAAARLFRKRFVFDQHDLSTELFALRYHRYGRLLPLVRFCERSALRSANVVLTTNEAARQRAIAIAGLNPKDVFTVPNGPDIDAWHFGSAPRRDGEIRIGYVGNINPQDGLEYLLCAAQHIHHTAGRSDIRFVCVGDGSALRNIIHLARQLAVDEIVEFRGRLKPAAALGALATCDICVQPDPKNDFNDSCTMVKSLEYMALGKPIVAFDLDETRASCGYAALYAETGTATELGELILRLADDPPLRHRMGAEGRRRIRDEISWRCSVRPLLRAYGVEHPAHA